MTLRHTALCALLAVLLLGLYVMAMVMLVGAGVAVRSELRGRAQAPATRRGPVSSAPSPSASGEPASTAYSGAGPSTS